MTFDASENLHNFTEKLKTASGKQRVNMVTWSLQVFAVNAILNLSIVNSLIGIGIENILKTEPGQAGTLRHCTLTAQGTGLPIQSHQVSERTYVSKEIILVHAALRKNCVCCVALFSLIGRENC